ncbi:hypothetical protein [Roseibium sp.]|uniref:hypothetical protein n=1 Tax=Roseibium sp. TaxID=1936156 RepID=UPI003D0FF006
MDGKLSGSQSQGSDGTAGSDARPSDEQLLPPDLIALAQGGACIILGAREADGRPVAGIGLGARIDAACTIRTYLDRKPNERLLAAITAGSGVAVTFSRAVDHASFQVKAGKAAIVPADPDDFAEVARQCAVSGHELNELGLPPQVAQAYSTFDPSDVVTVTFVPEQAFTQTPGPGAGSPVRK